MHELQLSSANTGWAPVFLQTNEITFPQHCTRAAEGRRGNGERRLSSGEGGRRRWDGGKRWSTCFADFSPRSTFKSAHSMRRRISSRRRLECETERATGFIIGRFPRDLTRISHLDFPNVPRSTVESVIWPNYETRLACTATPSFRALFVTTRASLVSRLGNKKFSIHRVVRQMGEEKEIRSVVICDVSREIEKRIAVESSHRLNIRKIVRLTLCFCAVRRLCSRGERKMGRIKLEEGQMNGATSTV